MDRGIGTGEAMKPGLHRKLELLLHRNFKHLGYMKGKKARSDAPVYGQILGNAIASAGNELISHQN